MDMANLKRWCIRPNTLRKTERARPYILDVWYDTVCNAWEKPKIVKHSWRILNRSSVIEYLDTKQAELRLRSRLAHLEQTNRDDL